MTYGIEAINVFGGVACIAVPDIVAGRGLDPKRFGDLAPRYRAVALPAEDPVTHAVNAAVPLLERLEPGVRERIELVVTATESGLDYSKSLASYVHQYLGLDRTCATVEVKQACFAATAALKLAGGYVASGIAPGAKVLLIATDVAVSGAESEYAEPATGTGAVAMLVGDEPHVLAIDAGAYGNHTFETFDSARPLPDTDVVDVDQSLLAYLECLAESFRDYRAKVENADFVRTFDFLAMHTPFAGMVRAGHHRMMREAGASDTAEEDFVRRVIPSLVYPGLVGNLFSGSLYLALASLIDHAEIEEGARVGLYSYGSGCSSEFFSGVVGSGSRARVAHMGIGEALAARHRLDFAEYERLAALSRDCLRARPGHVVPGGDYRELLGEATPGVRMLALREVDNYRRSYEWC